MIAYRENENDILHFWIKFDRVIYYFITTSKKVLGYRSSFHIMQLTVKNTKNRIKSYIETHHSEITHNYYNFNARYWQSKLEFTYLLIKRNWQENNEQNLIVIQWKCFIIIFSVVIANFSFGLFFSTIFLYLSCPVKSLLHGIGSITSR